MAQERWTIVFEQGATYYQSVTVNDPEFDVSDALEWELTCATPDGTVYLTANTDNGMIVAGNTAYQKFINIPAATTADFPLGNGRFDLQLYYADDVVRRYYSLGLVQVNPAAGVTP
jgi:hypothetical protein